jgi:flagellar hook-associated protein 2
MSTLPSVNLNALYAATGSGATGIDVAGAVAQILYARRATERQWQAQQSLINLQTAALTQLNSGASQLTARLDALQSPFGSLMASTVTSTEPAVITATAVGGTAPGNHVVTVQNLAAAAAWYSDAMTDSSTPFVSGSFDLTVGTGSSQTTKSIEVGNGVNTPADLVKFINGLGLGLTASVVNDANGVRVALTGNASGNANDFSVSPTPGTQTTNIFTRAATANNASLTVDGVPVSSESNSVAGVVDGVTLNLKSQAPGTSVVLSIGPDVASAQQAVGSFVSCYNTLIQQVNAQFAYDPVNQTSGPLGGDSTVRMLQSALLAAPGYSGGPVGFSTLRSLGITMNGDGTLAIDDGQLSSALQGNPPAVRTFFQGAALDGFAAGLKTALGTLADPSEGAFSVDLKSLSSDKSALQNHIDDFESYLANEQARLTDEYNRINIILLQLPQRQKQINAILGYTANGSNGQ